MPVTIENSGSLLVIKYNEYSEKYRANSVLTQKAGIVIEEADTGDVINIYQNGKEIAEIETVDISYPIFTNTPELIQEVTTFVEDFNERPYGSVYHVTQSSSESSTTSTYVNKVRLSVQVPTGSYELEWYSEINGSMPSTRIQARIIQDDTTVLGEVVNEPSGRNDWMPFIGFAPNLQLSGSHYFDFEFGKDQSNTIVSAKRVRLKLIKVL